MYLYIFWDNRCIYIDCTCNGRSCLFTFAYVQLMALLLLRHALTLTDEDDDDTSAMFSVSERMLFNYLVIIVLLYIIIRSWYWCSITWQLFLLRAAGFLLPFYIMAWAVSILQRRRQRQVSMLSYRWFTLFSTILNLLELGMCDNFICYCLVLQIFAFELIYLAVWIFSFYLLSSSPYVRS